ncbi:MarR family winged helix-turn-helix transcriptional regulator [Thermosediminibacter oceani]|uniref:Transcriptional regulator, MarR family n=1 Tax=Thermosediminibacter oceani (strain ATCC BAA-1034 / DSM 16646 / JW/IW-1228P) TaxID=555079 RepID=D9RYI6_THEOJ|nr:MarR family transcriptional regulator [Thermosediminibacter oceani]ADL08410.1 transcriptional regulator, MarR family [Thermosediminibacter oceani DSM 16646]
MEVIDPNSLYSLFLKVSRLHYLMTRELLEKINIYPGQPPLLLILYKHGGQSQRELAERLKVKPATITVMLNRIEKAGLIVRKQDDNDQRISRVYITEKGREICSKLREIILTIDRECFKDFNEQEKETLAMLFQKMTINLEKALNNQRVK